MSRIVLLIVAIIVLIGAVMWMSSDDPRGDLEQVRNELPNVEMGTGTATIPVPVDADIVTKEREVEGRTIEYPSVDVTTEDKTIEYPTVEVTPANNANANPASTPNTVDPVMQDPNDPVPAVNAEKAYEDTKDAVKEGYEDAKDAVNKKIDEMDKNNNGSIVE